MRIFLTLLFLMISANSMAQTTESIEKTPSDFRWENRILIVIAESESDSLYNVQLSQFEGRNDGFDDRDLIIFHIFRDGTSRLDEQPLKQSSADGILNKYGSDRSGFKILLIGKDGGVKLENESPVAVKDIFGLIDSMPMRQREMREGTGR